MQGDDVDSCSRFDRGSKMLTCRLILGLARGSQRAILRDLRIVPASASPYPQLQLPDFSLWAATAAGARWLL
jgi:hypothetical protein